MTDDWFVEAIEATQRAAEDARAKLQAVVELLETARRQRIEGVRLPTIVEDYQDGGGRAARRDAAAAMDAFWNANMTLRGQFIRSLVDDHGLTLSEVARRLDVSRQMVARLYRPREDERD